MGNDHELTIVAYTDVKKASPNTKLISISKRNPLPIRLLKFLFALIRVSKEADIIYVQNAMAAGLPVAINKIITGKPFIVKFVGDEAWERASQARRTTKSLQEFLRKPDGGLKSRAMMSIQKFVMTQASMVTTPSAYLREEILKAYKLSPQKVVTNYNASEKPQILPFQDKVNEFQIITVVRLVKWKGVDGIIQALVEAQKHFPQATLVVAGDGPEMENLKSLSKELNIDKSVKFLGNISKAEVWQLSKSSGISILNSTYEGLPHTVLNNFAAEIPTIATDIPGTNEVVYDEKTGLLIKPGDSLALARAIERLFTDDILREELTKNGLKLLGEKFSWESHIRNLKSIIESVLSVPSNKF